MSLCSWKDKLSNKTDYMFSISKIKDGIKKSNENDQIPSSPERDRLKNFKNHWHMRLQNNSRSKILTIPVDSI